MDSTLINTLVGFINTIVGIVGIICAIVGGKSLIEAKNIINSIKIDNGSHMQNASIIVNGMDSYAVIKLSKDTTKEELIKMLDEMKIASSEQVNKLNEDLSGIEKKYSQLSEKLEKKPNIYFGETEPMGAKEGDIWLKPTDKE